MNQESLLAVAPVVEVERKIRPRGSEAPKRSASLPKTKLLKLLLWLGRTCHQLTGRHVLLYGFLGELYAARKFRIELHKDPHREGSDGRLGNQLVEIKTIAPRDEKRKVRVKKTGNFGLLAIVSIDADFKIEAKLIRRRSLRKSAGNHFSVYWDDFPSDYDEIAGS